MTFRKICLLAAMCLLAATSALADQRPPVHVQLAGPPSFPGPDGVYKGRLEIVSAEFGELTNFRFEGAGWRQKSLAAPDVFIEKDGRLEIAYELEAGADPGELKLVFEYDGFPVSYTLDLTEAHYRRMTSDAPLSPSPDADAPGPADPALTRVPVPDVPLGLDKNSRDEEDDPTTVVNRSIRVRGRFTYQRSDGVTIGADGVWVRVYDEDTGLFATDDLLASVSTDAFGYYDVYINTDDAGETNPDLFVHFQTENSKVLVEDPSGNNVYKYATGVNDNYSGSDWNLGSMQPSDEGEHPALHILTDVTRTWRWIYNHEGYDTPSIRCNWPNGTSGAFYNGEMYVSTGREWNEATHSHEYGHHWIGNYAVQISPDYCNGICDTSPSDCGHCIWCQETDHDAFSEGWPNWLADVLTRSYAGDYGIASQIFRSQEDLFECTPGNLDDPLLTEGFLGALLRDIEDTTNDDHPQFAGYADVMGWGTNEIFDVVDFDHPTTPMGFLNAFKARFPSSKEPLWETAKNCGYEIDVTAPGNVTGLSSSHATTGDSPDPTIYYSWTTAFDDASGIAGYGLFISAGPGMPSAVQDIGDVNSYTTPVLSPGTYYFNIRAVDRAGRWSSTYTYYGPVTIRAAEPSDLTSRTSATWDYPIVPRNDNTATVGLVEVSPFLDGNTTNTYWNTQGQNQGESSTSVGFQSRLYVDNVYRAWWSWGVIGAGGWFYGVNGGPVNVKGGRHTFEVKYDATDQVAEEDETNNVYAHQFIWTPLDLTADTPTTRGTPPELLGGWDSIIDGQPKYYNCDGVAPTTLGWWNALAVHATDNADDYDIRLHQPTTGSEDGFGSNLGFSSRAAGCLDAVLFNRNVTGTVYYNGGVLNWGDDVGNFVVEHVRSTGMAFGDSIDVAFAADDYIVLKEFLVASADTGYVSITVDVDPAQGPVYVQWLNENFATGTLSSYSARDITDGVTGRARLDFHVPDSGYNCLVMYRDPKDGGGVMTATVEVAPTPPDLMPLELAGWHAPLVPRPAFDGTAATVALPDTLHGNVAATYLNFATRNDSPNGVASLPVRAFLDGVFHVGITWPYVPGYTNRTFNWDNARTIRGGRHTLDMRLDPLDQYEEIWENNNIYGEQYVWSPLALAAGTQVTRTAPPDRVGGWDEITSGEVLWYNCDGLRIPSRSGWWQAMAVMPGAGSDVDIRLHPLLSGAKNGFGSNMGYSGWGQESSDFSLVNYNLSPFIGYDAGVLRINGATSYTAQHAVASFLATDPSGPHGGFNIPAGSIVQLHEINLSLGTFAVHLIDEGGGVDWGMSLFGPGNEFQSKSSAMAGAWAAGPGEKEEINNVAITTAGYHCLVVWKAKTTDLARSGNYTLVFGNGVVDVPDAGLPQVTALRSVYPNPFNPRTTIVFDLAKPATTEIAIYDLKGALVRTLQSEALGVGRHEAVWDGTDNRGQRVASGVYMARMRAGDFDAMKKLMLVK